MTQLSGEIFLEIGLWFGRLVMSLLEMIFPELKDKEQNLHGFQNYYLTKFNLSNKENLKRNIKSGFIISISVVFWVYCIILLNNISLFFNLKMQINLLIATIAIFLTLFLLSVYFNYKENKK